MKESGLGWGHPERVKDAAKDGFKDGAAFIGNILIFVFCRIN